MLAGPPVLVVKSLKNGLTPSKKLLTVLSPQWTKVETCEPPSVSMERPAVSSDGDGPVNAPRGCVTKVDEAVAKVSSSAE